ncbi:Platinum sensitivity protein [Cladochytrium tenue]|nr:Platinum sensitivity protein [Cladochytrium tenue]
MEPDRRRVKLYELDAENQWLDKGTGLISQQYVEVKEGFCLIVRSEEDASVLLNSKIRKEDTYHRQQDIDQLPHTTLAEEQRPVEESRGVSPVSIPEPTLGSIKDVEQAMIAASRTMYSREHLANLVTQENYILKLIPLLETCEDLECLEDLFSLSNIMRIIIFLNDAKIYESILDGDTFLSVVGMLEFVPIRDKQIVEKIQRTYRLLFLKDVALARLLDDHTFSSLNSLIFINHVEIVNYFQNNEEYMDELFNLLNQKSGNDEAVKFLLELCGIARGLPAGPRNDFYRTLSRHGLLSIFDHTLGNSDLSIRLAATAILSSMLEHDPSLLRSYCVAQASQGVKHIVDVIITRFLDESDLGLKSQLIENLRILLDTSAIDASEGIVPHPNGSQADELLTVFFEKSMQRLASPILSLQHPKAVRRRDGWDRLDEEEEAYFNGSDGEDGPDSNSKSDKFLPSLSPDSTRRHIRKEAAPSPPPTRIALVDYPDDDEEDARDSPGTINKTTELHSSQAPSVGPLSPEVVNEPSLSSSDMLSEGTTNLSSSAANTLSALTDDGARLSSRAEHEGTSSIQALDPDTPATAAQSTAKPAIVIPLAPSSIIGRLKSKRIGSIDWEEDLDESMKRKKTG